MGRRRRDEPLNQGSMSLADEPAAASPGSGDGAGPGGAGEAGEGLTIAAGLRPGAGDAASPRGDSGRGERSGPAARAGSPRPQEGSAPPKGIQIPPPSPAGHVQAAFAQGMGQLLAVKEFAIAKSRKKKKKNPPNKPKNKTQTITTK